jgi:hypothetical protein
MTSAPLEELEFDSFTSHVPFDELLDRLESHLKHQARMPNLDERLRMAAAKAISEGRRSMTDMSALSATNPVEEIRELDEVSLYLIAAE